jgi:hypothetical protein
MPYHVFLAFQEAPTERCVLKDLTEADLKRRFVEPFKRQGTLLLDDQEVVDAKKVQRFKITLTDEPLDVLRSRASEKSVEDERKRNSSEGGVVFLNTTAPDPDSSHGKDVSSQYVNDAPGSQNWVEVLIERLKRHPVVLILVVVVAALTWTTGAWRTVDELWVRLKGLWEPSLLSKTIKADGAFFGGDKRMLRMTNLTIQCVDGACKLAGLAATCAKEYVPHQSNGPSIAIVLTDAAGKEVSPVIRTTKAWVESARDYTPIEHQLNKGWVSADVWNRSSSFILKGWVYREVLACS